MSVRAVRPDPGGSAPPAAPGNARSAANLFRTRTVAGLLRPDTWIAPAGPSPEPS